MTLDELYERVKNARYPINDRDELQMALGDINVEFEGSIFSSTDISTMINEYPILKASHVIELFIDADKELELDDEEAEDFREVEEVEEDEEY